MAITKPKQYGLTSWGRLWIQALESFADDRLKRGKSYANTGRVKTIKIRGEDVEATVIGNYAPFYYIRLALRKCSAEQSNLLRTLIQDSPSLITELARGSLPKALVDICEEQRIPLLPRSWSKDFQAKCSCPDYGDPCKHQAAVSYVLASEIDKDPMLLLRLRGIDLEGLDLPSAEMIKLSNLDLKQVLGLLGQRKKVGAPNGEFNLEEIFLSETKPFKLLNLLTDNPPFANDVNFKAALQEYSKDASEHAAGLCSSKELDENLKYQNISYKLNPETEHYLDILSFEQLGYSHNELLRQLLAYPLNLDLEYMEASFRYYLVLMHLALQLVQQTLFFPEPIVCGKESFCIRYKAKLSVANLSARLDLLDSQFNLEGLDSYELLNYFISFIVHETINRRKFNSKNKLVRTFFSKELFYPEDYTERNILSSINNWLERLDLDSGLASGLLRFELDAKGAFSLHLDVRSKGSLERQSYYQWLSKASPEEAFRLKRQLSIISEYITDIKKILDSPQQESVLISLPSLSEILVKAKSILDFLGLEMIFPKELAKLLRPQLKVKVKSQDSQISLLKMNEMLDFSYELMLGDQSISVREFQDLVANARGLVKFRDQYVFIDPEQIKKLWARLEEPISGPSSSNEAMFALLSGEYKGLKITKDKDFDKFQEFITKEEVVEVPYNLDATLRPYQEQGFRWLYTNFKKGLGSCIADDMGLGKTLQVIALLLALKNENKRKFKPALVVLPTALLGNWSRECAKFAASLKVETYHGSSRRLPSSKFDVLFTSYGTFRRDIEKFSTLDWGLLIIDEAQNIKNSETKQSKALKKLKANAYIAMTGTPVENRLSDLWSIMDFVNRGYLGSLSDFRKNFAEAIERSRDKETANKLQMITAPFLLRRLKTDKSIISDLPEKIISDEYCSLTPEQAALYQAYANQIMNDIEQSEDAERRGLIFKLITSLKQICNHPYNFTKEKNPRLNQSGKAMQLIELSKNIIQSNEKLIVFTQYTEMGKILEELIGEELGEPALFFHGGLSPRDRDAMVDQFQNNLRNKIMIISLKAGGVGLNLTAANHVMHYDLWWNPAVENQATDRAFRIGQKKNVMVHRFITMASFEEKIDKIIKSKQELADMTISAGESWITKLSNEEIRGIFGA